MGKLLTNLISADKLGGWMRAIVASVIGVAIAKWPSLQMFATPEIQDAVGVAAAGLVVGLWSHVAKKLAD